MTILTPNTDPISRVYVNDLESLYTPDSNRELVPVIMDYHDGNDVAHIKRKMAERFATEITTTKDPTTGATRTAQVKSISAQRAAIRNNLFEIVARGMTRKIANNAATLSENSEFTYTDQSFGESLAESRQRASFGLMLSRLDEISVVTGSSVMLLQVNNGDFQYQPLTIDKVTIVFGETLSVNGKQVPVDSLKIDHAQCVVIQIDDEKFAAYFARSDRYPQGRFVQYEAKGWHNVPDIGAQGATEYTCDDSEVVTVENICNPLTMYQDVNKDYTTPEYPIITWQGTTSGIGTSILPTQTNLYEISLEIDLSSSRVAMAANKGARGAWYFTDSGGSMSHQPASGDEGIMNLPDGQTLNVITVSASNITAAAGIIDDLTVYLADQWNVPTHLLKVGTRSLVSGNQMPSGVALLELNRPKVEFEAKRRDMNSTQMKRNFELEKALAGIENGSPVGVGVEQEWVVNPADILKTDTEVLLEQEKKIEMGLSDSVIALMETEGLTREEAQAKKDGLIVVTPANTTANRLGIS